MKDEKGNRNELNDEALDGVNGGSSWGDVFGKKKQKSKTTLYKPAGSGTMEATTAFFQGNIRTPKNMADANGQNGNGTDGDGFVLDDTFMKA